MVVPNLRKSYDEQKIAGIEDSESAMPMIRVREKNQITLPGEVVHALGLDSPGHLQYTPLQDGVLIRAVGTPAENKLAKLRRLAQSVTSVCKGRVTADDFISQQRDAWQK